mmetsp:Transcript_24696/g.43896  ORF Transcript_24696/g.43896 Transcript_24696/m.43896 type:complete len:241 (+) Transcript_24696:280-1002(+)|eukprot:CAMPEP_0197533264 /NCGR_PEP_ID=MMETSP1318-20131121/42799_1 /TAXON_ID=552666 /ORGANISM="Partenskyella glossopodia, Strain RCC365" /LENGTH=240 /DNA_ID=CAMNT_0043090097 /DNA_START=214 /DNA_END=936 /DNA_ORIENTATION=-
MIQAQKAQLEKKIQLDALHIQQQELQFFISNFQAVASQAAFLAGFSLSGMYVDLTISEGVNNMAMRILYYVTTSLALGFLLLCVTNSTICTVYGPEKALLGREGSMGDAIAVLKNERQIAFTFFGVGMMCFHVSAIFFSLIMYHTVESALVTVVLFAFIVSFIVHGRRIYGILKLDEQVTGALHVGDFDLAAGRKSSGESKQDLERKIIELKQQLAAKEAGNNKAKQGAKTNKQGFSVFK